MLRADPDGVFNERDASKRDAKMEKLFADEPVMYEPTDVVRGRAAIADAAGELLKQFGPTFRFTPVGTVGRHGLGSLQWQAGPNGGPTVVTGADAAEVVDGRIARLCLLLNRPASSTET